MAMTDESLFRRVRFLVSKDDLSLLFRLGEVVLFVWTATDAIVLLPTVEFYTVC